MAKFAVRIRTVVELCSLRQTSQKETTQNFSVEGSLNTLRDFFDAVQALVGEAIEREGKTENIGVATIGPPPR